MTRPRGTSSRAPRTDGGEIGCAFQRRAHALHAAGVKGEARAREFQRGVHPPAHAPGLRSIKGEVLNLAGMRDVERRQDCIRGSRACLLEKVELTALRLPGRADRRQTMDEISDMDPGRPALTDPPPRGFGRKHDDETWSLKPGQACRIHRYSYRHSDGAVATGTDFIELLHLRSDYIRMSLKLSFREERRTATEQESTGSGEGYSGWSTCVCGCGTKVHTEAAPGR